MKAFNANFIRARFDLSKVNCPKALSNFIANVRGLSCLQITNEIVTHVSIISFVRESCSRTAASVQLLWHAVWFRWMHTKVCCCFFKEQMCLMVYISLHLRKKSCCSVTCGRNFHVYEQDANDLRGYVRTKGQSDPSQLFALDCEMVLDIRFFFNVYTLASSSWLVLN